jgi:peroxiredoxin
MATPDEPDAADVPAPGDDAPTFTAPLARDGIEPTTLADHLDGPVVLAFFPAAFSGTCTTEFCTFRDHISEFETLDATVLGLSTDLPWALEEFRDQESLPFGLVSDNDAAISETYGVKTAYERLNIPAISRRAVFVVDERGTVTYRWLAPNPGAEPDYDEVSEAVADAA